MQARTTGTPRQRPVLDAHKTHGVRCCSEEQQQPTRASGLHNAGDSVPRLRPTGTKFLERRQPTLQLLLKIFEPPSL